jgi:uncharacterized membrane protein
MGKKVCKNVILFMVGFCSYVTIEVLFRGFSYPMMGVCGGFAIVILDKINDRISWNIDLVIQGIIGMLVVTGMELVIGLSWEYLPIPVMWDYSNIPLNYRGIICVPFMIIWFFLSLVAIFLADAINYYVFEELPTPYYVLCKKIIFTFPEKKCNL